MVSARWYTPKAAGLHVAKNHKAATYIMRNAFATTCFFGVPRPPEQAALTIFCKPQADCNNSKFCMKSDSACQPWLCNRVCANSFWSLQILEYLRFTFQAKLYNFLAHVRTIRQIRKRAQCLCHFMLELSKSVWHLALHTNAWKATRKQRHW